MIWLARLTSAARPERLAEDLSRAEIHSAWDEIEARVRHYASSLSEAQLDEDIEYSGILGDNLRLKVRDVLLHIVNHGTAHRAEICAMFHMIGHTIPFELSYTRYRVRQP
jgi:uncharacterized damage-inducible protein DinB